MGGNQSNGSGIYIQLDQPFFYAGQNVTGKVHLCILQPYPARFLYFKIIGKEKTHWVTQRTETYTAKDNEGKDVIRTRTIPEPHRGETVIFNSLAPLITMPNIFPPGQYSIPFSMNIPSYFPGTFEIDHVDDGFAHIKQVSIRYKVIATLESLSTGTCSSLKYKIPLKIRP